MNGVIVRTKRSHMLTLKVLDNATETVAMGSNQHPLPFFDLWSYFIIPKRKSPSNGVFQTLTTWKLVFCQISITSVLQQRKYFHAVYNFTVIRHESTCQLHNLFKPRFSLLLYCCSVKSQGQICAFSNIPPSAMCEKKLISNILLSRCF